MSNLYKIVNAIITSGLYAFYPPSIIKNINEIFSFYSSTVPRFDQHILDNFMKDGHFSQHLNRMRKIYRKKYEKLTTILGEYYP